MSELEKFKEELPRKEKFDSSLTVKEKSFKISLKRRFIIS